MTYTTYTIGSDAVLSEQRLNQILTQFQTLDLPVLKRLKNYYDGNQDIIYKQPTDTGKANNVCVTNFCKTICDSYTGYMLGKQVSFMGTNIEEIQEILDYNDIHEMISEYLRQGLIYGRGFLINYIDKDGKQRIQVLDSQHCIPIYDDSIEQNLLYVVRFWIDNSNGILDTQLQYKVELYGPENIKYYTASSDFATVTLDRVEPHYFHQCPITVFHLNRDEIGVFKPILSLQDNYNNLQSYQIDGAESWADSYLVLTGVQADEKSLENMKKHRCIILPGEENCGATFLTKSASDAQIQTSLESIEQKIWTISQTADFSNEQLFGSASSGVSLRFKLMGMECACAGIESELRKSIQRMIELFCEILNLVNTEETWRDVQIIFRRNLPIDMTEIINVVNGLRGVVSVETLLSQIPFVDSPEEEMEKLKQENDILELYDFNHEDEHPDEEEVTGDEQQ